MAVVARADGAAQEAGGAAEVAGAGVGDVVVAADGLLGHHGDGARRRAAHDAVGAVGLVGDAGVRAGTHHVGAGLCHGERTGRGRGFSMSDPGLAEISPDAKIDSLHQFHIGEICVITATL